MKEEKKFTARVRFNLLDAVLILLAILCVVGIWQRHNLQNLFASNEEMDAYTVTFEIRKLRSTTVELLTKDTELYLEENGERVSLGTLAENVSSTAASVYFQDEDGNTQQAFYPQDNYEYLLDVKGKLNARGIDHNGAFLLEGKTHLAVNRTVTVHTETADLEIRIINIEKNA